MFLTDDIDAQPGLFALLPQVVDAVGAPVIAAGGIADGRGIAAAFALGARAVQIGTAYLRTPEATISAAHRRALADAETISTRLTNLFTGRPARGLVNRFVHDHGPMNPRAPAFPTATAAVAPLRAHWEAQGSETIRPFGRPGGRTGARGGRRRAHRPPLAGRGRRRRRVGLVPTTFVVIGE